MTQCFQDSILQVKRGLLRVNVHACVAEVKNICRGVGEKLYTHPDETTFVGEIDLWLIAPRLPDASDYPDWLSQEDRTLVESCHRAWAGVLGRRQPTSMAEPRSNSLLADWHWVQQHLDPVTDAYMLFAHPSSKRQLYFAFIDPGIQNVGPWVYQCACYIAELQLFRQGSIGQLHASAVRQNGKGYVFVARSGGGKSTTARESMAVGAEIIDDDIVCIGRQPNGDYSVMSTGSWNRDLRPKIRLLPGFYEGPPTPLTGIFVLVQDLSDYVVRLPAHVATRILLGAAHERYNINMDELLAGNLLDACCTIAKEVPVFELHCRKGPMFWTVIDDVFHLQSRGTVASTPPGMR